MECWKSGQKQPPCSEVRRLGMKKKLPVAGTLRSMERGPSSRNQGCVPRRFDRPPQDWVERPWLPCHLWPKNQSMQTSTSFPESQPNPPKTTGNIQPLPLSQARFPKCRSRSKLTGLGIRLRTGPFQGWAPPNPSPGLEGKDRWPSLPQKTKRKQNLPARKTAFHLPVTLVTNQQNKILTSL